MKFRIQHSGFFHAVALATSGILLFFGASSSPGQIAVGLDFVGGASGVSVTNMGTNESAGVVAQTRWNNLTGASGTSSTLVNSANAASGLTVSYTSLNTWADGATNDTAGNNRMMRGYLDFNVNNGSASVAVSGLSSLMYDVYVYTNGDTNAGRTGLFTLDSQAYWVKDQGGFSGTFVQGTGNVDSGSSAAAIAGNYMVFSGLTGSSFTLNATGVYTTDGVLRAPINAVQIVAAQNVLYWDRNGTTAGAGAAPTGNWTSGSWTTSSAGTTNTTNWTDGAVAVLSAGTNATGTYAVDLQGTNVRVNSLLVQEGNVTVSNSSSTAATLGFSDATPDIRVETGSTATINVGITNSTTSASMTGLQKLGGGTLVLGGSATTNAYVGKTQITEGTLRLAASGVIPNASALTLSSGATLDVNGFTETVGSLAGAGAITLGGGTLIAGGDNSSTLFSGTLSGGGLFQKNGTGTFTLGADLTYNGELRLNGGTLALNGFDLTTAVFHVTGNSILDFGSGLASIFSTTSFLIDSGVTLTVNNWVDTVDYFYATNNPGGAQGSAPMNQIVFAGFTGNATHWQSFNHEVTPVPESATYGAILLGSMLGLFGLRRWRRPLE